MKKRFLAILLTLAAVLTLLGPTVSADYENTYVNTGDMRKDLIGVALTQVGYTESERNFTVDDEGNRHGYSRYGAWYGVPYADWSAIFVSFCLFAECLRCHHTGEYLEVDRCTIVLFQIQPLLHGGQRADLLLLLPGHAHIAHFAGHIAQR